MRDPISTEVPGHSQYLWHQVPVFRMLWPYIAGVIPGIFWPGVVWIPHACVALSGIVLVACVTGLPRFYRSGVWMPAFLLLGWTMGSLHTDRLFNTHYSAFLPGEEACFIGELTGDPIARERSLKCEVELQHIIREGDTQPTEGKILVYIEKDSNAFQLAYGDLLCFRGALREIPASGNPGEFDYRRYMRFHQVGHRVYLPAGHWIILEEGHGWLRHIVGWQKAVIHLLEVYRINDEELAILSALLVGYKHHLSRDQVSAFASAGAMHVLAVSGLHVGIVFLLLTYLLKPLEKIRFGRAMNLILSLVVLWGYAILTGLSPSVTRAVTMFSVVIAGQWLNRHTNVYNTLATSALILLIVNPFLIMEVGFQLSYLAVLGIVILQPRIYALWQPKNWLLDKTWAITAVSIAAQVATFPLALLYFHQFPNYFLLSNLVVIPAAMLILPLGMALIAFSWWPVVADPLAGVLYSLVHGLDRFIHWIRELPWVLTEGIDIGIPETWFIYLVIIALVAFLLTKRYRWLVVFLAATCVVQGWHMLERWQQQRQKAMVFYSIRGHHAIDLIDGNRHLFLADTALSNDLQKMRFHIHPHWWQRDLELPAASLPGFHQNRWLFTFDDQHVAIANDTTVFDGALPDGVDVLIVSGRTPQHPKEVLEHLHPGKVLLSTTLDWKSARYWKHLLETSGREVHDLRTDGALVVDLASTAY